jgi:hypothetical protein
MPDALVKFLFELLAYGGGSAAIAYFLFQFLGKTWIENKFAQRLEQLKHQQALEVQRLRVEIDSMLSGAIKLQDREFDVLPKAWQKLDEAHGLVSWLVAPMQSYPDLDRMDSQELSEFFDASELRDSQRQRISNASKKTDAYIDIIFWHRLNKVRSSIGQLRDFVAANGIFLPPELKDKFVKVVELLWSALTAKQVGVEAKDYKLQTQGWEKIKSDVEPLYKSIEAEIQARLQSHAKRT